MRRENLTLISAHIKVTQAGVATNFTSARFQSLRLFRTVWKPTKDGEVNDTRVTPSTESFERSQVRMQSWSTLLVKNFLLSAQKFTQSS